MLQTLVLGCLSACALAGTLVLLMASIGREGMGCVGFAFLELCLLMGFAWLFRVTRRLVTDKPLQHILPPPALDTLLRVIPCHWRIHREAFIHALATEAVEVLLQWGADLSARNEEGFTALDYTTRCGEHWKTCSVILSHLPPGSLEAHFHREALEARWGPIAPQIVEQLSLYQNAPSLYEPSTHAL